MPEYIQVDVRDGSQWTPFLWSCYTTSLEMASLLLQHGADVNAKGVHHCTGIGGPWSTLCTGGRGQREHCKSLYMDYTLACE